MATRLCKKQEADRGLERFMSKRGGPIEQIDAYAVIGFRRLSGSMSSRAPQTCWLLESGASMGAHLQPRYVATSSTHSIEGVDGNLYGTTTAGGALRDGFNLNR